MVGTVGTPVSVGVSVSFFNYPWSQLVPTFIYTQTLFLSMVGTVGTETADMGRDCGWELELFWDGIEMMEMTEIKM